MGTTRPGRFGELLASGQFWSKFWLTWVVVWLVAMVPTLTVWKNEIAWTNFMSDMALILACAGAWQSSLTMRKADPEDPL